MEYLLVLILLLVLELSYFKIADRFNIIDKPNQRSSHTEITLRGGGVVFYFASLVYFIQSGFQYPWFFLGLTMMSLISFLDDVYTLSSKIRLIVHFSSVLLMANELNIFEMPWYYLLISFVFIVGVINAYNFMDGINGITACYSISVGGLLLVTNYQVGFIDEKLLIYVLLGVCVFAYFNFRSKARCFAGDVGSVSIAFILLFALGALILKSGNYLYLLFLSVYGIDAVWTIMRRLYLRENIFEPHRTHLYQYLANEARINKLVVASLYGGVQFVLGLIILFMVKQSLYVQVCFAGLLLLFMSLLYLIVKNAIIKKYNVV